MGNKNMKKKGINKTNRDALQKREKSKAEVKY